MCPLKKANFHRRGRLIAGRLVLSEAEVERKGFSLVISLNLCALRVSAVRFFSRVLLYNH